MAGRYRITVGDGRSTEALVAAGAYGYAHSCVISENFPAGPAAGSGPAGGTRDLVLLEFDRPLDSGDAIARAAGLGLARPTWEDALRFGAEHPEVQRERPVVFLHQPWLGYFGRWDVLCLWTNAGRRELGLEDFHRTWDPGWWLAFVGPER